MGREGSDKGSEYGNKFLLSSIRIMGLGTVYFAGFPIRSKTYVSELI